MLQSENAQSISIITSILEINCKKKQNNENIGYKNAALLW